MHDHVYTKVRLTEDKLSLVKTCFECGIQLVIDATPEDVELYDLSVNIK
ncbi:MAG: hypothetical protein VKN72_03925 [Nostocales cyanobacterium 94392]|nr:hypothetical protein [Nostocales cyanobacterium 94392]